MVEVGDEICWGKEVLGLMMTSLLLLQDQAGPGRTRQDWVSYGLVEDFTCDADGGYAIISTDCYYRVLYLLATYLPPQFNPEMRSETAVQKLAELAAVMPFGARSQGAGQRSEHSVKLLLNHSIINTPQTARPPPTQFG